MTTCLRLTTWTTIPALTPYSANGAELDGRNLTVAVADENRHKDKGFGGTAQDVNVSGYQVEKISEKDANIRLRKPRMERGNDEGYEYVRRSEHLLSAAPLVAAHVPLPTALNDHTAGGVGGRGRGLGRLS